MFRLGFFGAQKTLKYQMPSKNKLNFYAHPAETAMMKPLSKSLARRGFLYTFLGNSLTLSLGIVTLIQLSSVTWAVDPPTNGSGNAGWVVPPGPGSGNLPPVPGPIPVNPQPIAPAPAPAPAPVNPVPPPNPINPNPINPNPVNPIPPQPAAPSTPGKKYTHPWKPECLFGQLKDRLLTLKPDAYGVQYAKKTTYGPFVAKLQAARDASTNFIREQFNRKGQPIQFVKIGLVDQASYILKTATGEIPKTGNNPDPTPMIATLDSTIQAVVNFPKEWQKKIDEELGLRLGIEQLNEAISKGKLEVQLPVVKDGEIASTPVLERFKNKSEIVDKRRELQKSLDRLSSIRLQPTTTPGYAKNASYRDVGTTQARNIEALTIVRETWEREIQAKTAKHPDYQVPASIASRIAQIDSLIEADGTVKPQYAPPWLAQQRLKVEDFKQELWAAIYKLNTNFNQKPWFSGMPKQPKPSLIQRIENQQNNANGNQFNQNPIINPGFGPGIGVDPIMNSGGGLEPLNQPFVGEGNQFGLLNSGPNNPFNLTDPFPITPLYNPGGSTFAGSSLAPDMPFNNFMPDGTWNTFNNFDNGFGFNNGFNNGFNGGFNGGYNPYLGVGNINPESGRGVAASLYQNYMALQSALGNPTPSSAGKLWYPWKVLQYAGGPSILGAFLYGQGLTGSQIAAYAVTQWQGFRPSTCAQKPFGNDQAYAQCVVGNIQAYYLKSYADELKALSKGATFDSSTGDVTIDPSGVPTGVAPAIPIIPVIPVPVGQNSGTPINPSNPIVPAPAPTHSGAASSNIVHRPNGDLVLSATMLPPQVASIPGVRQEASTGNFIITPSALPNINKDPTSPLVIDNNGKIRLHAPELLAMATHGLLSADGKGGISFRPDIQQAIVHMARLRDSYVRQQIIEAQLAGRVSKEATFALAYSPEAKNVWVKDKAIDTNTFLTKELQFLNIQFGLYYSVDEKVPGMIQAVVTAPDPKKADLMKALDEESPYIASSLCADLVNRMTVLGSAAADITALKNNCISATPPTANGNNGGGITPVNPINPIPINPVPIIPNPISGNNPIGGGPIINGTGGIGGGTWQVPPGNQPLPPIGSGGVMPR